MPTTAMTLAWSFEVLSSAAPSCLPTRCALLVHQSESFCTHLPVDFAVRSGSFCECCREIFSKESCR